MNKINFFCINLETRTDRWFRCEESFKQQNIEVTRWNATPLPENRRFGAWLSHREIIELAKRNSWEYVWVFEDDIKFLTSHFIDQCDSAIQSLQDHDWYILYFGGFIWTWWVAKREKGIRNLLRVQKLFEAHAVIYHKSFYDIYLKKHPSSYSPEIPEYYLDGKYTAFDQWFADVVQFKYPCYITEKILVSQYDDFSSIENKKVMRYKSSLLRFYAYKILWSKITTWLDSFWSKIKKIPKRLALFYKNIFTSW